MFGAVSPRFRLRSRVYEPAAWRGASAESYRFPTACCYRWTRGLRCRSAASECVPKKRFLKQDLSDMSLTQCPTCASSRSHTGPTYPMPSCAASGSRSPSPARAVLRSTASPLHHIPRSVSRTSLMFIGHHAKADLPPYVLGTTILFKGGPFSRHHVKRKSFVRCSVPVSRLTTSACTHTCYGESSTRVVSAVGLCARTR